MDVLAVRPPQHESLAVVVPWTDRRFQYTVKDVTRPAHGRVTVGDTTTEFEDAWAVFDHGRGRWFHNVRWNWGAGVGHTDGHLLGMQFGARWTEGTGMTENALMLDGRVTKISMPRRWLPRVQVVEYLRAFLIGRAGWSAAGGLLIISLPRLFRTWELLMAERRGEKISGASSGEG